MRQETLMPAAGCMSRSDRRIRVKWVSHFGLAVLLTTSLLHAEEQRPDEFPPLRTLNAPYHPWTPSVSLEDWKQESSRLREQVLVAVGLWPLPEKTPLQPVIHGKVERDGYTVERVFFASRPGHYVTGSLYKPAKLDGKVPGVLCPYGHWSNGRFHDAATRDGDRTPERQLESGAEQFLSGARFPLQARMVQLARMGCVVFHYDMIGTADSQPLNHRQGFNDTDAALWLHGHMGLQTWNSIRALDFLESLPEVDPQRIGVTGASGGGTQTFVLCALDPRPAVAFPAVMVSTAMQGGCVCENACYLRQDINNIALAALCAPRPMAMTGADDWTIDIETKGLPELKQVYGLYGQADLVHAKTYPQFRHNYNQVSREMMYDWFNQHLGLNLASPIHEQDFQPLTREEMTVFDEDHPLPQDALTADKLRDDLRDADRKAFQKLLVNGNWKDYQNVVGRAARVMLQPTNSGQRVRPTNLNRKEVNGIIQADWNFEMGGRQTPVRSFLSDHDISAQHADGKELRVFWFEGTGHTHLSDESGKPRADVSRLLAKNLAVASATLPLTGESASSTNPFAIKEMEQFPGYVYGYNRPLLTERVRQIHGLVEEAHIADNVVIDLVGTGGAGLWVLMARALLPEEAVGRTIVDLDGFSFSQIESASDPNMLPGALKYGGIGGLAGLAFPGELWIYGVTDRNAAELEPLKAIYVDRPERLHLSPDSLDRETVVDLLLKERD